MRAVLHSQTTKKLTFSDTWPVPVPKEDEYLLKVRAAALTNGELDWPRNSDDKDYSPGVEMSGQVAKAPAGGKFPIGSNVYMRIPFPQCGAAREYSIGSEKELALHPKNLTWEQGASVPVSALTAWQAFFEQAKFAPTFDTSQHPPAESKKKVLVTGASGSSGMWMVQLAKLIGCWVAGTCHTRNTALVRDFGADEVIDYTKTSIRDYGTSHPDTRFDLVIDCAGGNSLDDSWHVTRPGGLVLTIVPPPDMVFKFVLERPEGVSPDIEGRFFIMKAIAEHLQQITELIEAGKLKPLVDSVYKLEEYEQAFEHVYSRKATGKVVLKVPASAGSL